MGLAQRDAGLVKNGRQRRGRHIHYVLFPNKAVVAGMDEFGGVWYLENDERVGLRDFRQCRDESLWLMHVLENVPGKNQIGLAVAGSEALRSSKMEGLLHRL